MSLLRYLRSLWLRWLIWDTERYLAECAAAGLVGSLSIREFRRQVDKARCELMVLRARAKGARKPVESTNHESGAAADGGPAGD